MSLQPFCEEILANEQSQVRLEHLRGIEELVGNVYPNKFARTDETGAGEDTISALVEKYRADEPQISDGAKPAQEDLDKANATLKQIRVRTAGRLATPPRIMGKAAFVHLSDGKERLQIYVRKQDARAISNANGEVIEAENSGWDLFALLDHGDFIGVSGFLFVTKTGELSIHVETLQFLSKALMPMPDKLHGISDPELRRRYRYVDLIADSLKVKTDDEPDEENKGEELTSREVFERRARLISGMRRYLDDAGYIEVETPMLTPKATGAAAKPFETHHNALDIPLYARVAPELYLKRLVVGGFEKVYELNRNFRNEGLSQRHNPEFTMLEFYCAYMDVNGMMNFAEAMIKDSVQRAVGSLQIKYGDQPINFSGFERSTMKDAIADARCFKEEWKVLGGEEFNRSWLDDSEKVYQLAMFVLESLINPKTALRKGQIEPRSATELEAVIKNKDELWESWKDGHIIEDTGVSLLEKDESVTARNIERLFATLVEPNLIQPTFIIDFPKDVSPLSKASPTNPQVAERFELFINGMEVANGFSELNDPNEQELRFREQQEQRERGDEEAMILDEDYIRALSYGMPPAAGIGIGIDRLAMLLTNRHSIRDVILFPHMRPERKQSQDAAEAEKSEQETVINPS